MAAKDKDRDKVDWISAFAFLVRSSLELANYEPSADMPAHEKQFRDATRQALIRYAEAAAYERHPILFGLIRQINEASKQWK